VYIWNSPRDLDELLGKVKQSGGGGGVGIWDAKKLSLAGDAWSQFGTPVRNSVGSIVGVVQ
jgi:hypothetical protein